ncbi:MAG TPA: hypothetical protein VHZ50_16525 [Puia sp.]|jgi:predicted nucleotide-binding protein|nr:hypothetical protein [Puia sp.]
MNITLSADDILDLILEMEIEREDCSISSTASFLAIMAMLEIKLSIKNYVQSNQSDKLTCKIQAFNDKMTQIILEKESLALAITDQILRSDIHTEIIIYNEMLSEYNKIFDNILHKE